MSDLLGVKEVEDGINSVSNMPENFKARKVARVLHGILFIAVCLIILASLLWLFIEIGDATIWRSPSQPPPLKQITENITIQPGGVFNQSSANSEIASQPVSTPTSTSSSSLNRFGEVVLIPPEKDLTTQPPLVDGVLLSQKKVGNLYQGFFQLYINVVPGTGAPTVNSIVPPSNLSCNIPKPLLPALEPGVAISGEAQGRIVYVYNIICTSTTEIAVPSSMQINYSYGTAKYTQIKQSS